MIPEGRCAPATGSTPRGFRADAGCERTSLARGYNHKSRARKQTVNGENRPEAALRGVIKQEARQVAGLLARGNAEEAQ